MPLQAADLLAGLLRQMYEERPLFHDAAGLLKGITTRVIELERETLLEWTSDYPEFRSQCGDEAR